MESEQPKEVAENAKRRQTRYCDKRISQEREEGNGKDQRKGSRKPRRKIVF